MTNGRPPSKSRSARRETDHEPGTYELAHKDWLRWWGDARLRRSKRDGFGAKALLAALINHANRTTWLVKQPDSVLADEVECDVRHIDNLINVLIAAGKLAIIDEQPGKPTVYKLLYEPAELTAQTSEPRGQNTSEETTETSEPQFRGKPSSGKRNVRTTVRTHPRTTVRKPQNHSSPYTKDQGKETKRRTSKKKTPSHSVNRLAGGIKRVNGSADGSSLSEAKHSSSTRRKPHRRNGADKKLNGTAVHATPTSVSAAGQSHPTRNVNSLVKGKDAEVFMPTKQQQYKLERWRGLLTQYNTPDFHRLPSKPESHRNGHGFVHGIKCMCVDCWAARAVLGGFITNLRERKLKPQPLRTADGKGYVGSQARRMLSFDLMFDDETQHCVVMPDENDDNRDHDKKVSGRGSIQEGELVLIAGARDGDDLFVNEVVRSGEFESRRL